MMALSSEMVGHLYVAPAWIGRGIGSRLIELAKSRRPGGLDLYTFQVNVGRAVSTNGMASLRFGAATGQTTRKASRIFATPGGRPRNRWVGSQQLEHVADPTLRPKRARAPRGLVNLGRSEHHEPIVKPMA